MSESAFLQILIQGGAVGIAILLAWIVYKLAGNHINHNTEVLRELSVVIGELKQVIKDRK